MHMSHIEFLLQAAELNEIRRTGWEQRGVTNPQNVAGHTWGVSLLTMLYADEAGVDKTHAMKIALIHDLPEVLAGDIAAGAGRSVDRQEQFQKEKEALNSLVNINGNQQLSELWEEYEKQDTDEAVFVRDMDLIEMCIHALKYEREQRYDPSTVPSDHEALDEFFSTAEKKIKTSIGEALYSSVREVYEQEKSLSN